MRKFLAASVLATLLATALAACGDGGSGAGTGSDSPSVTTVQPVPMDDPIDRARDVVDDLNQHEDMLEQQTGG